MSSELSTSKFSDEDLDTIEDRLNKAFELAGTKEEFDEFRKIQLEYQKLNFGKLTDPRDAPFWNGSFFAGTPEEWEMAIALLIEAGFPKTNLKKIFKEEMSHYKKSVENGMDAYFIIRFCYDTDGGIIYEPSVISQEYEMDENYGNKIKDISDIPESSSDWDKDMSKLADYYNKT